MPYPWLRFLVKLSYGFVPRALRQGSHQIGDVGWSHLRVPFPWSTWCRHLDWLAYRLQWFLAITWSHKLFRWLRSLRSPFLLLTHWQLRRNLAKHKLKQLLILKLFSCKTLLIKFYWILHSYHTIGATVLLADSCCKLADSCGLLYNVTR